MGERFNKSRRRHKFGKHFALRRKFGNYERLRYDECCIYDAQWVRAFAFARMDFFAEFCAKPRRPKKWAYFLTRLKCVVSPHCVMVEFRKCSVFTIANDTINAQKCALNAHLRQQVITDFERINCQFEYSFAS